MQKLIETKTAQEKSVLRLGVPKSAYAAHRTLSDSLPLLSKVRGNVRCGLTEHHNYTFPLSYLKPLIITTRNILQKRLLIVPTKDCFYIHKRPFFDRHHY